MAVVFAKLDGYLESGLLTALKLAGLSRHPQAETVILDPSAQLPAKRADILGLVGQQIHPQRIILLSNAKVYGHGAFICGDCGPVAFQNRNPEHFAHKRWECFCPICHEMLMPQPISESQPVQPISQNGLGFLQWEQTVQDWAVSRQLPCIILRLFSPYGFPGASQMSRIQRDAKSYLAGQSPALPEDGYSTRDFTHLEDIALAVYAATQCPALCTGQVFNIGTGQRHTIWEASAHLQDVLAKTDVDYHFTELGDTARIRHSLADIHLAQAMLGYQPKISLQTGLEKLAGDLLSK